MIIEVLVNGVERKILVENNNLSINKLLTKIRNEIKTEYKRKKEQCELWFTNIIF